MSTTARASGFKLLRFAVFVALAGLGVAVFLIGGSYLYWQSERSASVTSQRSLTDQRNRLEAIKRERDDLQGSEETYKALIARGAFVPERRLDFVEAMDQLRKRHRLLKLEYEVFPQRSLKFATGPNYAAIDVLASRVRMKIKAYHDRELLAFLDEFPRIQRGFFPLDRCMIKRVIAETVAPTDDELAVVNNPSPATPVAPTVAIEAECSLEWVTLKDKRSPSGAQPVRASDNQLHAIEGIS